MGSTTLLPLLRHRTGVHAKASGLDPEAVYGVTIADVRGVNPRLSATLVTVTGRIQHTVSVNELCERLAATVCIESVDRITEVHL